MRLTWVFAVSGLTNILSVAAGFLHTCALRVDGTVWCWGAATADGGAAASLVPIKVSLSGATALAAGNTHTCALMADGTVRCWGQNAAGQLGDGNNTAAHIPAWAIAHTENGFISGEELVEAVSRIRKVDAIYTKDFSDLLGVRALIVTAS